MVEVIINGHAGRLEGRYHQAKRPDAPVALILHPHPQYGGTMNNKVAYALFTCFRDLGFSVLRFNFRGVGRSQGEFEDGPGELSDATIALDWLQAQNPDARQCWIAGYSFGAWIGLQLLMRRPDINNFVAVSPPANEKDFGFWRRARLRGCWCRAAWTISATRKSSRNWRSGLMRSGMLTSISQ